MKYTDKNGKQIREGDICRFGNEDKTWYWKVVNINGRYFGKYICYPEEPPFPLNTLCFDNIERVEDE